MPLTNTFLGIAGAEALLRGRSRLWLQEFICELGPSGGGALVAMSNHKAERDFIFIMMYSLF